MTNSNADDQFLRDMQNQCLADSGEHIEAIRAALLEINKAPTSSIAKILKESHSLKGNFFAVGFSSCGEFIHSAETALVKIEATLKALPPAQLQTLNSPNLEFLLSNLLKNLESYIEFLKTNQDDNSQKEMRTSILKELEQWQPEVATERSQPAAPQTTEAPPVPVSSEGKSEKAAVSAPVSQEIPVKSSLYLLCKSQDRNFAIPVRQVVEVVQEKQLTSSPTKKEQLLGLMNLRGEVLPILNLNHVFGEKSATERGFVIICEEQGHRFGFPIGHAEQIIELRTDRFQEITSVVENTSKIISHSFIDADKTILIVNIGKALAS